MVTVEVNGTPCRIFAGCPRTLPDLYRQASRFADRVFTVEGGKQHTFGEVFGKAAQLAGNLICLAIGAAWLATFVGPTKAVAAGVLPFVLGGVLKSILGAALLKALALQRGR